MSFATRLRDQRKRLGYTQPELAAKLGITKGAIGNYESGISSPRIEIMFKIFEVVMLIIFFRMKWLILQRKMPLPKRWTSL